MPVAAHRHFFWAPSTFLIRFSLSETSAEIEGESAAEHEDDEGVSADADLAVQTGAWLLNEARIICPENGLPHIHYLLLIFICNHFKESASKMF